MENTLTKPHGQRPSDLPRHLSARRTFHPWQAGLPSILFGGWFLWFLYDGIDALAILIFLCMLSMFAVYVYKVFLVTLSITTGGHEVFVTSTDLVALDERIFPFYTILVPLYREAKVLPYLIHSLLALDYPVDKLDIILLLEVDDWDTIAATMRNPLPPHFHTIIVPHGHPKTKPRACNVGLEHAHGQFLVIYDAEDRPDSDQLKKALVAFQRSDEQIICVQCRLNYYNPRQNLLTRLFTLEYSFWFDLFLPGLSATVAPIPLGGTSNHFRVSALRAIGGWDAFNLAEDCDLGMRLTRTGYRTVIVNSTTWEEANSQIGNWIRQRSRWIKGYLQTYLVHMRNPFELFRNLGWRKFLSFQLTVGGNPLVLLLSPLLWLLIAVYNVIRLEVIEQILPWHLPEYIYTLDLISLVFGNFTLLYLGICGAVVRNNYDLVRYVLLVPLYGLLQSIAAWKGFFQLLTKPHHWEKTIHGLFLSTSVRTKSVRISSSMTDC